MVVYDALLPYTERYRGLTQSAVPLRVTAVLHENSPVAAYDPVHLDNLLAWAVMFEATRGEGLPNTRAPYDLPVPLACLWRSGDGLPLWASTCFFPAGDSAPDTVYRQKRGQSGRFTGTKSGKFSVKASAGRWMDRRVPVPATVCHRWAARCVGDPQEIARLLEFVSFLGKERGRGFGSVREWRVETESESVDSLLILDGRLARPVPAEAVSVLGGLAPQDAPSLVGWTPPQWKPGLFALGWAAGTPLEASR